MRLRSTRVAVFAVALGGLVVVAVGGLSLWAVAGVRRAETARHAEVAERLFDGMEGALSSLIEQEEARSFLEYRTFYVPAGAENLDGATVRSPLADGPVDDAIIGYFQIDPDGTVSSPGALDADELAMAQGWTPPATNEVRAEAVRSAVKVVEDWVFDNAPLEVPEGLERLNSLGALRRSSRGEQQLQAPAKQAAAYQNRSAEVAPDAVDVRVTPLVGQRIAGDRWMLHRTVHLSGEVYRQGLVVDLNALGERVGAEVLAASGLGDAVALAWGDQPVDARRWSFDHTFGPPFQEMTVVAAMDALPGLAGLEEGALQVSVLVLGAALLVVGGALAWAVRAELSFAQRRSDFVAAVTHELKTPLTSIRMYAEMLRDGMVTEPDRQRAYHATITAESERLSRLIGNVLELARMERGQRGATPMIGHVEPVLREVVDMLAPHADAHGVRVRLDVAAELPPVRLDRDALVQVLMNLVDNAVKFGGGGEVWLRAEPADGGVALHVADRGPGVPPAQLPLIFEAFYRGERELTRQTRGTGIGLALVAGLVADMGGRVRAQNRDGGGLCVSVWLVG